MATTARALTSAWELLGPAPLFLQRQGRKDVLLSIGTALPGVNAPGIHLSAVNPFIHITGTVLNVYARAVETSARLVIATNT